MPTIYFRPSCISRISPDCTKCIVGNFTGQYRLDGLALGLARQRFPLPGRCISPLHAYIHQNLLEPFAITMVVMHLLLVTRVRPCQERRDIPACQDINLKCPESDYRASFAHTSHRHVISIIEMHQFAISSDT